MPVPQHDLGRGGLAPGSQTLSDTAFTERLGPTAKSALLAALQGVVNQALRLDPGTRTQLHHRAGAPLAIQLTDWQFSAAISAEGDEIRLLAYCEQPAAQVSARAQDLLAWMTSEQGSLAEHNIEVRGSTAALQAWQTLLLGLEIDWEDALTRVSGDLAGHAMAESLRMAAAWAGARAENIQRQLLEFVVEEQQCLPNRALFEDHRLRTQALGLGLDRLQARIERLQKLHPRPQ